MASESSAPLSPQESQLLARVTLAMRPRIKNMMDNKLFGEVNVRVTFQDGRPHHLEATDMHRDRITDKST